MEQSLSPPPVKIRKMRTEPVDNHFLTLAISAGVPAMLLLIWILGRAMVFCYRGWRYSEADSKEADLWRIMLALMSTFILNNFFGTSFTIYSIAPIGWLLIGWVSVAYDKLEDPEENVFIDDNSKWFDAESGSY